MAVIYTERERVKRMLQIERRKANFDKSKREARRRIEELHENKEIADELGLNPEDLEEL